jgi:hypothetical protein
MLISYLFESIALKNSSFENVDILKEILFLAPVQLKSSQFQNEICMGLSSDKIRADDNNANKKKGKHIHSS